MSGASWLRMMALALGLAVATNLAPAAAAEPDEAWNDFRQMLFAKIVPAIKKMDLLSDRQRQRFAEHGILQFENWADPTADVEKSPTGAVSARF